SSFTDQVILVRLTASKKRKISFNAVLTSPHGGVKINSTTNAITLEGTSTTHEKVGGKVKFMGITAVKTRGGKVVSQDGVLTVDKADEAILYISIGTNFNNYQDITGDHQARA